MVPDRTTDDGIAPEKQAFRSPPPGPALADAEAAGERNPPSPDLIIPKP